MSVSIQNGLKRIPLIDDGRIASCRQAYPMNASCLVFLYFWKARELPPRMRDLAEIEAWWSVGILGPFPVSIREATRDRPWKTARPFLPPPFRPRWIRGRQESKRAKVLQLNEAGERGAT